MKATTIGYLMWVLVGQLLFTNVGGAAHQYIYGENAKFVYELLKSKGGQELETQNGEDKERALRISATRLYCSLFFAPAEDGRQSPVYRCEWKMRDSTGEQGEYILGGLEGGDTLYGILSQTSRQYSHVAVMQLQCVRFSKSGTPNFACVVNR